MNGAIAAESLQTLAKGSRSFSFASHFMPKERREDAALLYALCRLIDDLADEAPSPQKARHDLGVLDAELRGQAPARALVEAFLSMAAQRGVRLAQVHELILGVLSDLDTVRVPDDRALLRYCYRVAGTVGLMMSPILGVEDPQASAFALDLGVAMQLTNICRDVQEDARMGRVYIPAHRLRAEGISQTALLNLQPNHAAGVARVVQDLLLLAEQYYMSAERGLHYIPAKPRAAIMVASQIYREIGHKLLRNGCEVRSGRTIVSGPHKGWVAFRGLVRLMHPAVLGLVRRPHTPQLHAEIADLPGADSARALAAGPWVAAGASE